MENDFSYVGENLERIRENVREACAKAGRSEDSVRIMAVTKTVAPEIVNCAIEQGIDLLGENRVQEFLSKKDSYLKIYHKRCEYDPVSGQRKAAR